MQQSQARNRKKNNHDKSNKKQNRNRNQQQQQQQQQKSSKNEDKTRSKTGSSTKNKNSKSRNNNENVANNSSSNNSNNSTNSKKDGNTKGNGVRDILEEINDGTRKVEMLADGILLIVGTVYIILCPFTKVEESFNMQACHDLLFENKNLENYDHLQYPGVVPRSFIGPIILSLGTFLSYSFYKMIEFLPFIRAFLCFNNYQIIQQYSVRIVLLSINIVSLSIFRRFWLKSYIISNVNHFEFCNQFNKSSIDNNNDNNNNNKRTSVDATNSNSDEKMDEIISRKKRIIIGFTIVFSILLICQFHYLFYTSRLLPNIFALAVVTISFAFYFLSNFDRCLQLLAISTIVWRSDTMVIALPMILMMCYKAYSICLFSFKCLKYGNMRLNNSNNYYNNNSSSNKSQNKKKVTKMKHLKHKAGLNGNNNANNNNNGDNKNDGSLIINNNDDETETETSLTDEKTRKNEKENEFSHIEFWLYYFNIFLKWFLFSGIWISIVTVLIVVAIDTQFWGNVKEYSENMVIWPEWEVFRFNAIENKSHNYGTSPFLWYFYSAIPKMLLANCLFAIMSLFKMSPLIICRYVLQNNEMENKQLKNIENIFFKYAKNFQFKWKRLFSKKFCKLLYNIMDIESSQLFLVCFIFVVLYSFLPHKETRFIYFIIPPMTLLSTIGVLRLWTLWTLLNDNNANNNNNNNNNVSSSISSTIVNENDKNIIFNENFDIICNECEKISLMNSDYYWLYVKSPYQYGWVLKITKLNKKLRRICKKISWNKIQSLICPKNKRSNTQYSAPSDAPKARRNQSKSSSKMSKQGNNGNNSQNDSNDGNDNNSRISNIFQYIIGLFLDNDENDNNIGSSNNNNDNDASICNPCGLTNSIIVFHYGIQLFIIMACILSFLFTLDRVYVSRFNYFGGYAIRALPSIIMYNYFEKYIENNHIYLNDKTDLRKYDMAKFLFSNDMNVPDRVRNYLNNSKNNTSIIDDSNDSDDDNDDNEYEYDVYKEAYSFYKQILKWDYSIWYDNDWNFEKYLNKYHNNHFNYNYNNHPTANNNNREQTINDHNKHGAQIHRTKNSKRGRMQENTNKHKNNYGNNNNNHNNNRHNKYNNENKLLIDDALLLMPINCIHIGNLAAISGVTLFMTPQYNPYFHFSKQETISEEDYANAIDPCNISQVTLNKYTTKKSKNLEMRNENDDENELDDENMDMADDRGSDDGSMNENFESSNNNGNKKNRVVERVGFDYLISEMINVPGYQLIDYGGIIYGLAERPFWKLFYLPMEPKLYILKKTENKSN